MSQRRDILVPVPHLQGARTHHDEKTRQGALGPHDVQPNAETWAEPHREEEHLIKDVSPAQAGDHQQARVVGEDNLLPSHQDTIKTPHTEAHFRLAQWR